MTDSLLSWDDLETEVANPDAAKRAIENLKNLDTAEAVAELDQQRTAIAQNKEKVTAGAMPAGASGAPLFNPPGGYTAETLVVNSTRAFNAAKDIVARMDAELSSGGRVAVDDKQLLNCKADLNQLVPFKYNWIWGLYLTASANNWMPAELSMERGAGAVRNCQDKLVHKLLARFYISYKYREDICRESTFLSCYRLITNPECRQYILRQSFESAMIHQAMVDVNDIFDPIHVIVDGVNLAQEVYDKDRNTFRARKLAAETFNFINDQHFTTDGAENIAKFLTAMTCLYGYFNFIAQLVPIYQLKVALERNGVGSELITLCSRLLRDMVTQTAFMTNFIKTAIEENPGVDISNVVNANFRKFIDIESDLFSTLHNSPDEFGEIDTILKYFANSFITTAGLNSEIKVPQPKDSVQKFIAWVTENTPTLDHEAGVTGSGGALGW